MKRFAAFSFQPYYPGGGWNDFVGSYDSLEEAQAHGNQQVDLQTGEVFGDKE